MRKPKQALARVSGGIRRRRRRGTRILLAMLLSISTSWGCTSEPLRMPSSLEALAEPSETRAAITRAMLRRGWVIEREAPGFILASWERPQKTAKVRIEYDAKEIRFLYGGSQNFDCAPAGDSCSRINARYNKYATNLRFDIAQELSRERANLPMPRSDGR